MRLSARLVQILVTAAALSFVFYMLLGLMPGDPIDLAIMADTRLTAEDAARLRALLQEGAVFSRPQARVSSWIVRKLLAGG
jgi:ABC-type dipeptide/oligopeptide/nickel transport system permease component